MNEKDELTLKRLGFSALLVGGCLVELRQNVEKLTKIMSEFSTDLEELSKVMENYKG